MKKIIPFIIVVVLLLTCCFGLTASAEGTAYISNDYEDIHINGTSYTRFNTSRLVVNYTEYESVGLALTETQQETLDRVMIESNQDKTIIRAEFNFKDGSTLTAEYLNRQYVPIYEDLLNNYIGTYVVDFGWPQDNEVRTDRYSLLNSNEYAFVSNNDFDYVFNVTAENESGTIAVTKGYVLKIKDEFYFADYDENDFASGNSVYDQGQILAYKITDEKLIEEFDMAMDEFYEEDFGIFLDDKFSDAISKIFVVLIFGLLPLAVLIVSLIFAIRSKALYKKLFAIISILAGSELIIFTILAILLSIYS